MTPPPPPNLGPDEHKDEDEEMCCATADQAIAEALNNPPANLVAATEAKTVRPTQGASNAVRLAARLSRLHRQHAQDQAQRPFRLQRYTTIPHLATCNEEATTSPSTKTAGPATANDTPSQQLWAGYEEMDFDMLCDEAEAALRKTLQNPAANPFTLKETAEFKRRGLDVSKHATGPNCEPVRAFNVSEHATDEIVRLYRVWNGKGKEKETNVRPAPAQTSKASTYAAVANQGATTERKDGTWTTDNDQQGSQGCQASCLDKPIPENTRRLICERDASPLPEVENYGIALALSVNRAMNEAGIPAA
ncbi:hypothetical protein FN846DRAFT_908457 [Sphaerosporella brunnea]|uniref:Uncharacterized protein n=1 Tax=Sphaerosporella brunnea TaxID=1250544 RepID=A0A5J5EUH5_9PEZI|nr:hypothetical protein FN846DRAFT_908457 [Sphaerosporella brunnea]